MITFQIHKPQTAIRKLLEDKINNLTKPKGSLGRLEDLALQLGWIQQSLSPELNNPCHIVFAGDHGVAVEKVSLSPQEVTYQMLMNFLKGGAGVNFLVRQHHFALMLVDAGVNYDFDPNSLIINKKIRKGTRNYLYESAMTDEEMNLALSTGAESVQACFNNGCNVICFGEMGIANTSSSALWMSYLTDIPLNKCIGGGSDHTGNIISHKFDVLSRCMERYKGSASPYEIMKEFGGYEMVMTVGAMLKAAELKMAILVDGFIMTNCVLMASKLYPEMIHYCIFGHQSDEVGHKLLLEHLNVSPLLDLGMRLGEGTGALCAYPIIESAARMINEMNTFQHVEVTKYF